MLYFAQNFVDGYKYCQDIIAPNLLLLTIYVWHTLFGGHLAKSRNCELKNALLVLGICISAAISYTKFLHMKNLQKRTVHPILPLMI